MNLESKVLPVGIVVADVEDRLKLLTTVVHRDQRALAVGHHSARAAHSIVKTETETVPGSEA